MRAKWIKRTDSKKLIAFFNGWGMDEKAVSHLGCQNYDLIIFYDYNSLEMPANIVKEITCYPETNVVCWSYGVWAYSQVAKEFQVSAAIAVNGTPRPIDENFGISENIFRLTYENLDEVTVGKFFRRMFLSKEDYEKFSAFLPNREISEQKSELKSIMDTFLAIGESNSAFDCAIISNRDKIIPTANQLAFWQGRTTILPIKSGHYPFFIWKSWDEVIKYAEQHK